VGVTHRAEGALSWVALGLLVAVSLLVTAVAPTSATVYGIEYPATTATVRSPTVSLVAGAAGSSTISSVAPDAATASVTAASYFLYYLPITLASSQGATPANFQQQITINPSLYTKIEASDLGNVRFCADTACHSELYSWLESCSSSTCNTGGSAVFWVNLGSNTVNPSLTIYMGFLPTSVEFDRVYAGETPTLSSTYGHYDNGAKVFSFYDNFTGTTLNAKWTTFNGFVPSVNNGLTLAPPTGSDNHRGIYASYSASANVIADTGIVMTTSQTFAEGFSEGTTGTAYGGYLDEGYASSLQSQHIYQMSATGRADLCPCSGTAYTPTAGQFFVDTFSWSSSGALSQQFSYVAGYSATTTATYSPTNYYYLQAYSGGSWTAYWTRIRLYPPGGAMPTTSFGSVGLNNLLGISNGGSSSYSVNLAVASSSNTGRLYNLTIWFYTPTVVEARLGSGVTQLTTGPVDTLAGSGTLYIALYVSTTGAGTTTVTLTLKVQPGGSGPYSDYTIVLTVN